jgi:glycosyltransferase involved in cell wall biosynthesis
MKQLAAVMIARNEQRCIKRALDSIRPYVDQMIVVDTGSTDHTILMAQAAGATVHSFKWCDDFSAARNNALDYSNAKWNLILDADEVLVEGGDELRLLVESNPQCVGAIAMDSVYDLNGSPQTVRNWLTRLLPQNIRYNGRVHEQPVHELSVKYIPVIFAHDGYLPAQQLEKRGRNERLLTAELMNNPQDPYLNYQLGKEKEVEESYHTAVEYYQKSLANQGTLFELWYRDLIIRLLFCLKKIGHFRQAIDLASKCQNALHEVPDFHFVLGDIYLDIALLQPQDAGQFLPLIEEHWLRCLEIGERPDLDGCVVGRGSTLAAHNLNVFYETIGLSEKAALYKKLF